MFNDTFRRRFKDLEDLSPWNNQQSQRKHIQQSDKNKEKKKPKRRRAKSILPINKSITERTSIEKSFLQTKDYQLPPLNKRFLRDQQCRFQTIEPQYMIPYNPNKAIRNKSSHKLSLQSTLAALEQRNNGSKFRLHGVRCGVLNHERSKKLLSQQPRPIFNNINNNIFLLVKSKDQVLKRVFGQIQGKVKQISANL